MPTQHVNLVGSAATNVTDSLTLTDGMNYTAQAQGGAVRITEKTDAADIDLTDNTERAAAESNAFYLVTGEEIVLRQISGSEIFAWSAGSSPTRLVVSTGYS